MKKLHGSRSFQGQRDPERRTQSKRIRMPVVNLNQVIKEQNAQAIETEGERENVVGEVPTQEKPPSPRRGSSKAGRSIRQP